MFTAYRSPLLLGIRPVAAIGACPKPTPPVGFNLFVLQNMTGLDSNCIARVTLPFFVCMIMAIVLITVFPSIVTSVPDWVMGWSGERFAPSFSSSAANIQVRPTAIEM